MIMLSHIYVQEIIDSQLKGVAALSDLSTPLIVGECQGADEYASAASRPPINRGYGFERSFDMASGRKVCFSYPPERNRHHG